MAWNRHVLSNSPRSRADAATEARRVDGVDATTLPTARVIFIAVIAVGWRLLTVPFCRGFAGIEAFNAFMAVKSQYFLFSTGTDNPFERGVPDNNV